MKKILTAFVAGLAMTAYASAADNDVEVLHYFTSGGESLAINAIRDKFNEAGGNWVDSPISGGGGDAHDTALRSRVLSGNAPGAALPKAPQAQDWNAEGFIVDLGDMPAQENWDEILPPLLRDGIKVDGKYVAVPIDIHKVNFLWINPELLTSVDGSPPQTWDDFNALADKLQEAGITPLAHGGQPWQDATLFDAVVLGIGGVDFYRQALVENDMDAIRSETMIEVFDQMRKLRGYVDDNFPGRDWNLATAMVMNGDAAMQIMGDWAKGEFLAADMVPGEDVLCVSTPGPGYLMTSNSMGFFGGRNEEATDAQKLLAATVLREPTQIAYTLHKGSIPARLGVSREPFDKCGVFSMEALDAANEDGSLVLSVIHQMASTAQVRGAMIDVITQHFNSDMSSEEAVEQMVEAIEFAQ